MADFSLRLHIRYDLSDEYDDIFADAYNEALRAIWKRPIPFLKKIKEPSFRKGYDTERSPLYGKYFRTDMTREGYERTYEVITIHCRWRTEKDIDRFQEALLEKLKAWSVFLWKFEDTRYLQLRKRFFEEIFELEMWLREILSFIFFDRYYDEDNLLRDSEIQPSFEINPQSLLEKCENQLFYLHFSAYKKALEVRHLSAAEDLEVLKASQSFEDYRKKILSRWVVEQYYRNFIEETRSDLTKIDEVRNSVMHNRAFSSKWLRNYEGARKTLLEKMDTFKKQYWEGINGNELGLVRGKMYESRTNLPSFKKGKMYRLIDIFWSDDLFFEGEDGRKVYFKGYEAWEHWVIESNQ